MKYLKTEIFLVLLVVASGLFLPVTGRAEKIDTGVKFFNQEELEQAERIFKSILETEPGNERALDYLTRIFEQRGNKRKSFEYYSRLADKPPEKLEYSQPWKVYRYAGILAYQVEEYRRALAYLERARELVESGSDRENLTGWIQRAQSAYLRKKRVRRKAALQSLLEEARGLAEQDRIRSAIELLEERREEFPETSALEELLAELKRRDNFQKWLRQVRDVSSETAVGLIGKLVDQGKKFYNRGQFKTRAAPFLGRLYFYQGEKLLREGAFETAKQKFFRSRSLARRTHPETLQELARAYYRLENYDRARELLTKVNEEFPGFELDGSLHWGVWWFANLRQIFLYVFLLGFAVVLAFVLLPLYGSRALSWLGSLSGNLLDSLDLHYLTPFVYKIFCRPDLVDDETFKQWVAVVKRQDDQEELRELLDQRKENRQLAPEHRLELGVLLAEAGEPERAREELEPLVKEWEHLSEENQARLGQSLAPLRLKRGDSEAALEIFKRLLELRPGENKLYQQVLRLAALERQWEYWGELGEEWIRRIRSGYIQAENRSTISGSVEEDGLQDPESIAQFLLDSYDRHRDKNYTGESTDRLQFLLSLVREISGEEDRKLELLEELLNRDVEADKKENYSRRLAEIYESRQELETALEYYEKIDMDNSENFLLLGKKGKIYEQFEKWEKAEECYARIFDYQQDNVQAARGLKQVANRYENNEEFEKAAEVYRTILDNSHFSRAELQLRLGVSLYHQGETEEALSVFQEIKHGGEDFQARVLSYVGRCLVELGMHDAAYSKLTEMDVDNPELSEERRHSLRYWLGRAAEGDDRPGEAREHYRQILASDVEFRDVAQRVEEL